MAVSQAAKEKVKGMFNLEQDIKESKIKTCIYRTEMVDGKIKADFEINGLPKKEGKKEGEYEMTSYEDRNKTIPKIFNSVDEYTAYVKEFFSYSDDELIKMCNSK